jgi:hypothetical protein
MPQSHSPSITPHLNATVKKIQQKVARSQPLPGHETRPQRLSLLKKLRGQLMLAHIALLGK